MNSLVIATFLFTIAVLPVLSLRTTGKNATTLSYCEKDSTCKSFAVDIFKKGVFPLCRNSVRGDVTSKKVCAIVFVKNSKLGYDVIPALLPPIKCQKNELARSACDSYAKTYSPDEGMDEATGKPYRSCQSDPKPYLCTEGNKKYVTCSVKAVQTNGTCHTG